MHENHRRIYEWDAWRVFVLITFGSRSTERRCDEQVTRESQEGEPEMSSKATHSTSAHLIRLIYLISISARAERRRRTRRLFSVVLGKQSSELKLIIIDN